MTLQLEPAVEAARMAAVRRYDVLDTPPDGAFDRITALAARLFRVPISLVTIVDTDRIWFKSRYGLDVEQIGRDPGLCASAIMQSEPWLVTDALHDPRTLANPLVAGEFGLRFYAAAPLTTHDGHKLGTLCVIDRRPREVTPAEQDTLRDLASLVVDELELRLSALRTIALETQLREHAEHVARALQRGLLPPRLPDVPGVEAVARYHVANRDVVGGDFYDLVQTGDSCLVVVGDACGKGTEAAALTGTARWTLRAITRDPWTPATALARLNQVLVDANDGTGSYCTMALASLRPHPDGGAMMTLSLGGHPHPLVVRSGGEVETIGHTAPIVGWLPDARFEEARVELHPNDLVVMFTDGLLEAVAGRGSSDDQALQRLLGPMHGRAPHEVADRLDDVVSGSEQRDDAAFLVLRTP